MLETCEENSGEIKESEASSTGLRLRAKESGARNPWAWDWRARMSVSDSPSLRATERPASHSKLSRFRLGRVLARSLRSHDVMIIPIIFYEIHFFKFSKEYTP